MAGRRTPSAGRTAARRRCTEPPERGDPGPHGFFRTATNRRSGCLLSPRPGSRGAVSEKSRGGAAWLPWRCAAAPRGAPHARGRVRAGAAAGAGAARSGRDPGPAAAASDAAGLGRVRRVHAEPRRILAAVRRHVRAVDGRADVRAAGDERGQRQAALDEERRDYLRYLGRPAAGPGGRRRAAGRPGARRIPSPSAWPRCSRPAGCGNATGPTRTSACSARPRRATARDPTHGPADGPVDGMEPVTALALRRFLRATPWSRNSRSRGRCTGSNTSRNQRRT